MNNLEIETKNILKTYGIHANKSLGQNFLIDESVVSTIVDKAEIKEKDLVIEIGPGLGTLTKELLKKAGKVVCIELDKKMIEILNSRFKLHKNFEVQNEDVLKVDLEKLIEHQKEKYGLTSAKVVANLPYYITTPIIMKLLEDRLDLESITVMIQKEVADRLVATPGEEHAGAITHTIAYYTEVEKILEVHHSAFIPAPEVDSSVICLKILEYPRVNVKDEKIFFKVIKQAFMQKRKTLLNTLTNGNILNSKKEVEEMLKTLGIEPNIRAEKLSIQDFAKISDYL